MDLHLRYSATFGQAIGGDNRGLLASYGKAILFDYHYRYFYRDGYGKDYQILNVDTPDNKYNDNIRDRVLLANLLTFYEQLRIYDDYKNGEVKKFYIENPLWIFVGSKVKGEKSDIVTILRFLQKGFMERTWTIRTIQSIIDGKSELPKDGYDFFARDHPVLQRLSYLRKSPIEPSNEIYNRMLFRVFHASTTSSAPLHVHRIKKGEGELGLKFGPSEKYFGVINVGEPDEIIKELRE